jgi:transcriptional/translational regulatory protein YebC/TACO1
MFYGQMKVNLTQRGLTVTSDGSEFIPKVTVPLNERDKAVLKQMITALEELEQVEGVHTNAA